MSRQSVEPVTEPSLQSSSNSAFAQRCGGPPPPASPWQGSGVAGLGSAWIEPPESMFGCE
eukprot:4909002-Prymnesium_polylepis.1